MRWQAAVRRSAGLSALSLLCACAVVPPAAPPAPPPPPLPTPAPPPPPPKLVAVEPEKPWDVARLSPGDWRYWKLSTSSTAAFGALDATDLTLRCDLASHRIVVALRGAAGNSMTVRTSAGDFTWPAFGVNAERSPAETSVTLPASDRAFDAIAFSRGRISVEIGSRRLIVPVWAEVSRVIEDCRS